MKTTLAIGAALALAAGLVSHASADTTLGISNTTTFVVGQQLNIVYSGGVLTVGAPTNPVSIFLTDTTHNGAAFTIDSWSLAANVDATGVATTGTFNFLGHANSGGVANTIYADSLSLQSTGGFGFNAGGTGTSELDFIFTGKATDTWGEGPVGVTVFFNNSSFTGFGSAFSYRPAGSSKLDVFPLATGNPANGTVPLPASVYAGGVGLALVIGLNLRRRRQAAAAKI
ncbi:MAG: hypothetical protein WCI73_03250 [Phycisphaerae bacterium]